MKGDRQLRITSSLVKSLSTQCRCTNHAASDTEALRKQAVGCYMNRAI